jgi:hypothetical protein
MLLLLKIVEFFPLFFFKKKYFFLLPMRAVCLFLGGVLAIAGPAAALPDCVPLGNTFESTVSAAMAPAVSARSHVPRLGATVQCCNMGRTPICTSDGNGDSVVISGLSGLSGARLESRGHSVPLSGTYRLSRFATQVAVSERSGSDSMMGAFSLVEFKTLTEGSVFVAKAQIRVYINNGMDGWVQFY